MMWKTMRSVARLSLVAVAYLGLCQATLSCFGGQKTDQLDKLNALLMNLTEKVEMPENIEAVRELMKSKEFNRREYKEFRGAVELYSQILPGDEQLCTPNNMRLIKNLFDLAGDCGESKQHLGDPKTERRLFKQLHEILNRARRICFSELQDRFYAIKGHLTFIYDLNACLCDIQTLAEKHAIRHVYRSGAEVKQLSGAVEMLKRSNPDDLFSASDLRHQLFRINELFDIDNMGMDVPRTLDEALGMIELYLIKPCERIVNYKEIADTLEAVLDLGRIVHLDDSVWTQRTKFKVGRFAAGYAVCKQLLRADRRQLVKKVATNKPWTWLIEH